MANQTVYPYGTDGSLPSSVGIINDLTTGGVDKALSAQQGVVLRGLTVFPGDYSIIGGETGKQSYGSVGETINIGALSDFEYIKISGAPESVTFTTHPRSTISSYIQYVNDEDEIVAVDGTSLSNGTTYTKEITFPSGAVAVYVNGTQDSISITGAVDETVKDRLSRTTQLPKTTEVHYTLAEADTQFRETTYNDKLIKAQNAIGSSVTTTNGTGDYVLKIPLTGVESVIYPMFKTTGGFGSVITNSNGIVVWEKANTTEPDNTLFKVKVSSINGAAYLLVGCLPSISRGIVISSYSGESIDINEYVLSEMPSSDYLGNSDTKVLNLHGASNMYDVLLGKIAELSGGGSMDAFNDFGTMPSCEYGDPGAFLADGLIDSDTTRIMYSDVIAKYDALVTKYPNYITKTVAGYDASGTIEMYYYTFTPKYWKQSIYLQAGVHGWEPDPVFALAEIMYLIANAYGTDSATEPYVPNNAPLKFLRGNVKITVFPVVNPWGFNNRGDCSVATKRTVAQNNYDNVQLNGAWGSDEAEAVMVRTLVASLASELSFAIDMHSTVWGDSRTRYGCFYGGVNQGANNVRTIYRTYEWLYQFYNVKYPLIVQGDQCPNIMGNYASVGYMTNTFNSYFYNNYNVEASTMEFSDHVWTEDLHTSIAMSVAVNMYLNQIIQQLNDEYKTNPETGIPSEEMLPAKG